MPRGERQYRVVLDAQRAGLAVHIHRLDQFGGRNHLKTSEDPLAQFLDDPGPGLRETVGKKLGE